MEYAEGEGRQQSTTALLANPMLGRRHFLQMTAVVGALHFLGSACGGRIMAYADDEGTPFFILNVVTRETAGILAVDVSNNYAGLKDVQFTIISKDVADATQSGTTLDGGGVVVPVRHLSLHKGDDGADRYECYATVEASLAGYRDYINNFVWVEGGPGPMKEDGKGRMPNVTIPMQKDDGSPYLRMLTFNDVDVQYNENIFYSDPSNDATHTLVAQVKTTKGQQVTVQLCKGTGTVISSGKATADAQGLATVTLSGQWLKGASPAIGKNDSPYVAFTVGSTIYSCPLRLKVEEALFPLGADTGDFQNFDPAGCCVYDEENPETKKTVEMKTDEKSGKRVMDWKRLRDYKDGIRWLKGDNDTISLGLPCVGLVYGATPTGWMYLSITMAQFSKTFWDKLDSGAPKPGSWKTMPGWSFYDKKIEEFMGVKAKFDERFPKDSRGKAGSSKAFNSLDFKFTVDALVLSKNADKTEDTYTNDTRLTLKTAAALTFDFGRQFFAGPIPVCVGFNIVASAAAQFSASEVMELDGKAKTAGFLPAGLSTSENWGFVMGFFPSFEVGVYGLVGIKGFLSAGVRAYGNTSLGIESSTLEKKFKPHVTVRVASGLQITMQMLFFSKTFNVIDFYSNVVYDSWKDKKSLELDEGVGEVNGNFTLEDFDMITEDLLKDLTEFSAKLSGQGAFTDREYLTERKPEVDDGLVVAVKPIVESADSYDDTDNIPLLYDMAKGIEPTYSQKILQDVYSDGRTKLVSFTDESGVNHEFMFRISLVDIEVEDSQAQANFRTVKDGSCTFMVPTAEGRENLLVASALDVASDSSYCDSSILCVQSVPDDLGCAVATVRYPAYISSSDAEDEEVLEWLRGSETLPEGAAEVNESIVTRGRLTVSRRSPKSNTGAWLDPEIIDFLIPSTNVEMLRANTFDADFDVVVDQDTGVAHIALVSMARPFGKEQSLEEQLSNQYVVYLTYTPGKDVQEAGTVGNVWVMPSPQTQSVKSLQSWNPVVALTKRDNVKTAAVVCQRFDQAVGADGNISQNLVFPVLYFRADNGKLMAEETLVPAELDSKVAFNEWGNLTVRPYDATDEGQASKKAFLMAWTYHGSNAANDGAEQEPVTVVWRHTVGDDKAATASYALAGVTDLASSGLPDPSGGAANGACFYYINSMSERQEKPLMRISLDGERFACKQVAHTGAVSFFADPAGRHLYAFCSMDEKSLPKKDSNSLGVDIEHENDILENPYGDGTRNSPNVSVAALNSTSSAEEVQFRQILRADYVDKYDGFFNFYPIAQIAMAPDAASVEGTVVDGNAFGQYDEGFFDAFIISSMTDLEASKADVHRVIVPRVVSTRVTAAETSTQFVGPGDTGEFTVTVANTGNVPLTGFTVTLQNANGTPVLDDAGKPWFSQPITDLYSHMELSPEVVRECTNDDGSVKKDDDGNTVWEPKPDERDKAGILWPGSARAYTFTFKVPDTAKGQSMKMCVGISDPVTWKNDDTDADQTAAGFGLQQYADANEYISGGTAINSNDGSELLAFFVENPLTRSYSLEVKEGEERDPEYGEGVTAQDLNVFEATYTNKPVPTPTPAPTKPTLHKVTNVKAVSKKKKRVKITWKTTKGIKDKATGYQISYRRKGTKKWYYKLVKGAKKSTLTLKKLRRKKRYSVKVRMYKKVSGKTYYGTWSLTRTVKVK